MELDSLSKELTLIREAIKEEAPEQKKKKKMGVTKVR